MHPLLIFLGVNSISLIQMKIEIRGPFESWCRPGALPPGWAHAQCPTAPPGGTWRGGDTTLIYDCGETRDERAMVCSFLSLSVPRERFEAWAVYPFLLLLDTKKNKRANSLLPPPVEKKKYHPTEKCRSRCNVRSNTAKTVEEREREKSITPARE